jgi:hypothetical protein
MKVLCFVLLLSVSALAAQPEPDFNFKIIIEDSTHCDYKACTSDLGSMKNAESWDNLVNKKGIVEAHIGVKTQTDFLEVDVSDACRKCMYADLLTSTVQFNATSPTAYITWEYNNSADCTAAVTGGKAPNPESAPTCRLDLPGGYNMVSDCFADRPSISFLTKVAYSSVAYAPIHLGLYCNWVPFTASKVSVLLK